MNITIRIHEHNNKYTLFTKLKKSIQYIQPHIKWYKREPQEYERMW
jgi:hypothetical protein